MNKKKLFGGREEHTLLSPESSVIGHKNTLTDPRQSKQAVSDMGTVLE